MDLISFIVFSCNTRYIKRWIAGGVILFIPVANFLSLGYLFRTCGLSLIGGIGLPTWEKKNDIWKEGARLAYIIILYEALPSFLFSFGFLLSSFGNFITVFIGGIMKVLALIAFACCTFFIPFAFCTFAEGMEVRRAFEFERIAAAVKEVLPAYVFGYLATIFCMYIAYKFHWIPYLFGFALSSILTFFVLLISTYYFTQLFKKTSLSSASRDLP